MTGEDQLNEKELQQVAGGVYIQQLKRVFCVTCQKDVSPHEEFECATRMHTLWSIQTSESGESYWTSVNRLDT